MGSSQREVPSKMAWYRDHTFCVLRIPVRGRGEEGKRGRRVYRRKDEAGAGTGRAHLSPPLTAGECAGTIISHRHCIAEGWIPVRCESSFGGRSQDGARRVDPSFPKAVGAAKFSDRACHPTSCSDWWEAMRNHNDQGEYSSTNTRVQYR
ncbi:unnamed protein product [Tuber aestivum]|uniref:Uncharacterized protein n=1 Tax=Tuber aestivum TaxID=59557 RepID=A0A292PQA2_9PEZI|nr:unnamed protein product [Tuber aestivum]